MPWRPITPRNTGGGRPHGPPTARLYESGQLTVSLAAAEMIGSPARVRIEYDTEAERLRIYPAAPGDAGSWALSGGGNSPRRVNMRIWTRAHQEYVGQFSVRKIAQGIELRKGAE